MSLVRERIEEIIETSVLCSQDQGYPMPLSPNQEDQYDSDWDPDDLQLLFQALADLYGPAVMVADLRHATEMLKAEGGEMYEFTTDHPDFSVYVDFSAENNTVFYLIGAPGWSPSDPD